MSMEPSDRKLFAEAIAGVVASGPDLDAALDGMGWREALADYPSDAVSVLFEQQGRARATSSALQSVLASALSFADRAAILLPALDSTAPPGEIAADGLSVNGLALSGIGHAERVLVPTADGAVLVSASALIVKPVHGMDPTLGLSLVEASGVQESAYVGVDTAGAWADVVAAGQRALAHELVGLARTMLSLAREHALSREQFGSPIARFQALRHKMAESLVAIEAADAAATAAWEAPGPLSAAIAKALAGQAARTTAKHAQQILAGMGFTTEHPFHLYFKRTLVLDHLLGSSRQLTEDLGRQLLATRELPAMLPL